MDSREGLEAALLASWDRETLAVYADHLQAAGDPRGELIALDLQLAQRSTPELVMRRASLLSAWLGMHVPSDPHAPWIGDSFRFGFVEDLLIERPRAPDGPDRIDQILASPLAPYLRRFTIHGLDHEVQRSLVRLAARPHAWLRELRVVCHDRAYGEDPIAVDASAFIAAAPNLALLEVQGRSVFDAFPHPAVRELRVDGWTALDAMFDGEAIDLPNVTALDFQFVRGWDVPRANKLGSIELALPALVRLDLSRNEPAERDPWAEDWADEDEADEDFVEDGVGLGAIDFLERLATRRQIRQLRLPSIRTADDHERVVQAIASMPALTELEIARGHYFRVPDLPAALSHVTLKRPLAWPWPPLTRVDPGESLHVVVPGSRSADIVAIADAVVTMERSFESLPAEARYAWTRLWVFVAKLAPGAQVTFPADLVVAATESVEIATGGWRQLRDELRYRRPLPSDATVKLTRTRD